MYSVYQVTMVSIVGPSKIKDLPIYQNENRFFGLFLNKTIFRAPMSSLSEPKCHGSPPWTHEGSTPLYLCRQEIPRHFRFQGNWHLHIKPFLRRREMSDVHRRGQLEVNVNKRGRERRTSAWEKAGGRGRTNEWGSGSKSISNIIMWQHRARPVFWDIIQR